MRFCPECNEETKYMQGGLCIKCYHKEYYKQNRDKILESAKEWYQNNKEKKHEYDQKRYTPIPKEKWGKRQKDFTGPCIKCGEDSLDVIYIRKMCKSCYKKWLYAKNNPKTMHHCIECGIEIGYYPKNKRCRNCRQRYKYKHDEEYRQRVLERSRKNSKTKLGRKTSRRGVLKRRAKLAEVEFDFTSDDWHELLELYQYRCAYCGKRKKLERDHVIPLSKGGPTIKDNIVPACRRCNSSKCDSTWFPRNPYISDTLIHSIFQSHYQTKLLMRSVQIHF